MKKTTLLFLTAFLLFSLSLSAQSIFLEAEGFDNPGGWTNDNQSMMQMGSPYLIAHGMGRPVEDAATSFSVAKEGTYRLWVRTRDWTKTWGKTESPGRFEVLVNGKTAGAIFGTESEEWAWQDGGTVELQKGENRIALHDLTGFEGRCDAIYLTKDVDAQAPEADAAFRKKALGLGRPGKAGKYDFVVVGGGIAGICAAITAARLGCKVALVQNRPVLGGNNSSEIRVGLSGLIYKEPYPNLGRLMDEIGGIGYWTNREAQQDPDSPRSKHILDVLKKHPEKHIHNAGPASNYEDDKKLEAILNEPNITLFLSKQAISAKTRGGKIRSIVAKDIFTSEEILIKGRLFADCTGDANLGFMAGADYRMGRESRAETGETQAPEKADSLTMGTSVQWYASETDPTTFPECPWAIQFSDSTCIPIVHGEWDWETGLGRDQVEEIERIRDHGLRAVYGNWAYLKNSPKFKEQFKDQRLEWVACIGGKRESRRLMGDVILKEQDFTENVQYDDASFTATWGMDLHYPKPEPGMEAEEPFRATSVTKHHKDYAVPYRCLYSRNIDNLLMAGRDISVTHAALGTIRVMRTGGMMGEVVGMAASICKDHKCLPRGVYLKHLDELKELMKDGTPYPGGPRPNLRSAIQPVPRTAVMKDDKYFIWCGTMVKHKDTYHLFYSRWEKKYGFQAWVTRSEVAHATSKSPFGPFTFRDVALPVRGAEYWDGLCTHNPTVHKFGSKYYLYYTGNTGDGDDSPSLNGQLNWSHRNNQRIGVAVADSPDGPWKRFDQPIIDTSEDSGAPDALMASNPAITQGPDGKYLMVYKAVGKTHPLPFGGPVVHLAAVSDSPTGPFEKDLRPIFTAGEAQFPAEDPFIWSQDGKYYAIVKDQGGYFIPHDTRALVLFESDNGKDWSLAPNGYITDVRLKWDDGSVEKMAYLERPQLFFENGKPRVLLVAVGNADMSETYNVQIPLK